ncbi:rod shape-determining protein MreD [Yoonia litorea]|uniref:Rod shape-determining protein MreD n=1 Tax=Yoonia litorea TaxID=1123755 RepID=A0A1I6N176_9RHOB|nr:rod shape-determining protein MreD [Yoonia litorea]SFS21621.1 rod shape-determining protein MreD [Yoonia litorea]
MAERIDSQTWMMRAIFVMLAFVLIVVDLVPLDLRPTAWAGPDILLLVTLVWVARRPAVLPVFVVAIVFLMADLLFLRPPGLWAALVVVLTEVIRRQHSEFRNMAFLVEWGTIAGGLVTVTLINRIVLTVTAAPRPPLGLSLIELVATILFYPVVVVLAYYLFGIRRAARGEMGSKGQLL